MKESSKIKNDKLLKALSFKNQGAPPIWIMRQAGRYLPDYRDLRTRYAFLEMCHQPELIAQVTQLPLRKFSLDAAILFSDILVVVEALGLGLRFEEGIGPLIERPLSTLSDLQNLPRPDIRQSLGYVERGIRCVLPALEVPLIGFCGAPFTVASYMIEGGASRDLRKTKQWMFQEPDSFHMLLNKVAELTIDYVNMQVDAGVSALQIFDSWAHFLADAQFKEFSLNYFQKIIKGLKVKVPVILFCRGSSVFAKQLAEIAPAAISVDWNADLGEVRKSISSSVAIQGNMDPDVLLAPKKVIEREALYLLNTMKGDTGYIFNLGHGILPQTPCDSLKSLIDVVKAYG